MTHDWWESAKCRDVAPELFFPTATRNTDAYAKQVAEAKAVCGRCPVRAECLQDALTRLPYGIAGGLTREERRGLGKRAPRRPAAPAALGERVDVDEVMVRRLTEIGAKVDGPCGTRDATRAEVAAAAVLLVRGPRRMTVAAAARLLRVSAERVAACLAEGSQDGAAA